MRQLELVKKIQSQLSFTATQREILETITVYKDILLGEILEGRGSIQGVGSFTIVHHKAHKGYNMHKKKVMMVPEREVIKFRASRALKNSINV